MTLQPEDIVWEFDGADGRDKGLAAMVKFYVQHLRELLPPETGDAFEQIVADMADDPTNRMLANPRLARLFPAALSAAKDADEFWRDSIHSQTRARIEAAGVVAANLDAYQDYIPVRLADVDAWAKTIGALRLFWWAELAGTERLAMPTSAVLSSNPELADLVEWLGYILEDLIDSRERCLRTGSSYDPDDFDPLDDPDV
ncbi:hypothetical protein GCM10025789_16710 [Tessaracoccus lubricantis]|uniref:DUF2017 domain-containing protein n=1 Tax=Tessaracoccus lubricantis TaxID=545543 RepID=A0ABP9FCU0_9ACTN